MLLRGTANPSACLLEAALLISALSKPHLCSMLVRHVREYPVGPRGSQGVGHRQRGQGSFASGLRHASRKVGTSEPQENSWTGFKPA